MIEKPTVVAWQFTTVDGNHAVVGGPMDPREVHDNGRPYYALMTVAQHERIVAGLEAMLTEAHDLVCECKKKIVAYRDHISNEYTGGPTLQTLMPRIDAFLAQTAEGG